MAFDGEGLGSCSAAVDIEIVTLLRNGRKKNAEGISIKDVRKFFGFFYPLCAFGPTPSPLSAEPTSLMNKPQEKLLLAEGEL